MLVSGGSGRLQETVGFAAVSVDAGCSVVRESCDCRGVSLPTDVALFVILVGGGCCCWRFLEAAYGFARIGCFGVCLATDT